MNAVSKKNYRGINLMLLSMNEFTDNRWVSYKQAQELGGHVKEGQKGTIITFWKMMKREEKDETDNTIKTKQIPLLRYYRVWNVQQCCNGCETCDGIRVAPLTLTTPEDFDPIAEAEAIIANMPNPPKIQHIAQDRAYFTPFLDTVTLPPRISFDTPEEYYSTAFHELGHSTGHKSRLNRGESEGVHQKFGDEVYSKEELVAEMTAAFLSAEAGIIQNTIDNSSAYLQSWINVLKGDSKLLIRASSLASRASDYILDRTNSTD